MIRTVIALLTIMGTADCWSVCLDPGHGGTDQGATGAYFTEKEANLEVAFMARSYLEQLSDCGEVGMTREEDLYVSLADRVAYANAGGYHRFVSIHHNAFDGSVQGTETYCGTEGWPEDIALRDAVHPLLVEAFQYYDRGVKTAGFYVLQYTVMPAILGEASFLDYSVSWDESWRFLTRWQDHDGREGWAYCSGLCQDQSSPWVPEYTSRVVDNSYLDFTTGGSGGWSAGTDGTPYGPDYARVTVTEEPDLAVWDPYIPVSGTYQVHMWWVPGPDRVAGARVTVMHDQGTAEFLVDQTSGGEEWYLLGEFPFHQGGFGSVRISTEGCVPGRVLSADAVRFKISSTGIGETTHSAGSPFLLVHPNPASSSVTIFVTGMENVAEVFIYDTAGRLIDRLTSPGRQEGFTWHAIDAGPGVYFAVVREGSVLVSTRIVILRG